MTITRNQSIHQGVWKIVNTHCMNWGQVNPPFIAPEISLPRNLEFELIITNEYGIQSEPASVTIAECLTLNG